MIFKIPLCGYRYVNFFSEIWVVGFEKLNHFVGRLRGEVIWFIEIVYYFYPAFPKPLKTPLASLVSTTNPLKFLR